jgi:hypothetical protein
MTLELDLQSVIDPRRVFLAPLRFLPQVFSHMILRHQKYQRKTTHIIFTLRTSIMHFYPNLTLRDTGNNAKKGFEENQNCIGEGLHQKSDHSSNFMKMVKERTRTMSAVNDERRQVLPSKVIWDGTIDRFEVFRNNVEGHYGQIGVGYLFDSSFQEAYLERGVEYYVECYVDFLDESPSTSQINKDARALYGELLSTCQSGVGRRILMENRDKQDGIRSWCQLVQQYETDGNRNVWIKRLESVIVSLIQSSIVESSIVIIEEDLLNGSKTMKMPSQNWLYLNTRLGMMMKSRSVVLYRMIKILVWLINFLKN